MILAAHQPQYLPWLGYFDKIAKSDVFVFLDSVQYKAREYQNRNRIRTASGEMWLTVPVISKGLGRQLINRIKIDNQFPWQRKHLSSLKCSYAHAEFFQKHLDFFERIYSEPWEYLSVLNHEIIKYILNEFCINTELHLESDLHIQRQATDRLIDICRSLKADTYLSGIGGRAYLEEEKFQAAGIKLIYQEFIHPRYRQQFARGEPDFMPYMSTVDLLFNVGPKSRAALRL